MGGIIFLVIVASVMVLFIVPFFRKPPKGDGHRPRRSDQGASGPDF